MVLRTPPSVANNPVNDKWDGISLINNFCLINGGLPNNLGNRKPLGKH